MKKETLAKLNYVLDSMQLSKEHKAALTDVFNDISSSGGGIDKFVLTLGEDNQNYNININGKYDVVLDNPSQYGIIGSAIVNDKIWKYCINNTGCYCLLSTMGVYVPMIMLLSIDRDGTSRIYFVTISMTFKDGPEFINSSYFYLEHE